MKDGLHELGGGGVGKYRVIRGQMVCKDFVILIE